MNSANLSKMLLSPPGQMKQKASAAEAAGNSQSFARYIEKKANQEEARQSQLGRAEEAERAEAERTEKKKEKDATGSNPAVFLLAILAEMKQMARDGAGSEGVFTLQGVDPQQLENLLQSMGLGSEESASFSQLLTEIDGPIRLDDFLTMLSSRLEKLTQAEPVTIPETELPLIQSLLAGLGISADKITEVTEPAVRGDNQLDLKLLVDGLRQLQNEGQQGDGADAASAVSLSQWELEQLKNLIAEAGVADEKRQAMLQAFLQQAGAFGALDDGKSGSLTLDQLTAFLDRLTATVQGQRPKIDVTSFADNIGRIFENVKTAAGQPSWTPLMQDSLQNMYKKLQEIVDFAKVSVANAEKTDLRQQYLAERADFNEAVDNNKQLTLAVAGTGGAEEGEEGLSSEAAAILKAVQQKHDGLPKEAAAADAVTNGLTPENMQPREMGPVHHLPPQAARPLPATIMQQQVFDQISKGVLRGVQEGEHHLVLKLQPPELGKVKVDLLVHDDQVTVSFSMENSKVKEALEGSMQQFRDNLEQRGFVLQQCFVSVGDGNSQNDSQRRFEEAKFSLKGQSFRQVELPGEMLYQRSAVPPPADGSISLFI